MTSDESPKVTAMLTMERTFWPYLDTNRDDPALWGLDLEDVCRHATTLGIKLVEGEEFEPCIDPRCSNWLGRKLWHHWHPVRLATRPT
jgi:hypothetical protein